MRVIGNAHQTVNAYQQLQLSLLVAANERTFETSIHYFFTLTRHRHPCILSKLGKSLFSLR